MDVDVWGNVTIVHVSDAAIKCALESVGLAGKSVFVLLRLHILNYIQ